MTRAEARAAFLAAAGWADAEARPLAGDASARRYDRLTLRGAPAVLMDAPPEAGEALTPFLAVTAHLRGLGLSAPAVLHADPTTGFALLEDLGDALFARVCADDPAAEPALYAAAVDLLADLQSAPPPAEIDGWTVPPYDAETLAREALLAVDWYLAGAAGPPPPDLRAEFAARLADACAEVAPARGALVLRDYHAENLIWLPDRRGTARVGLLDYQDALRGHGAYDLVSLLEDARRDTSEALRAAMTARFAAATGADAPALAQAAAALTAQRNLKIVGIFARLARRDAKPRYLSLIPRVWAHLQRDLSHPALGPLATWCARHLPPPTPAVLARIGAAP